MFKTSAVIIHLIFFQFFENILIAKSSTTTAIPLYTITRMHADPNFIRVMTVYKRTQTKIPQEQLRSIATIGLINGAIEAEKNLEKYLTEKVADLILNVNLQEDEKKLKIDELEKIIERDRNAIRILGSVLDLASQQISSTEYKNQLKKIMRDHARGQKEIKRKLSVDENMDDKMFNLKTKILDHVGTMKHTIEDKTNKTMLYLEALNHLKDFKIHRSATVSNVSDSEPDNVIQSVLKDNFEENLIDSSNKSDSTEFSFDEYKTEFAQNRLKRKQNLLNQRTGQRKNNGNSASTSTTKNVASNTTSTAKRNSAEENMNSNGNGTAEAGDDSQSGKQGDDDIFGDDNGGVGIGLAGGLPGLIASLSGGEDGSDIGALLGAITGLVSQLFGPGGLDIPSLISTGTSLIAGLLGGGRNFGTVLGEYIGLALDGLSGGGGADLNGKFLGNLIGTTLAELSAVVIHKRIKHKNDISNPEDEDGPPKPALFIQNFLKNFIKAKNRMAGDSSEESSSGEKRNAGDGNGNGGGGGHHGKGSDSFGFIKHIISAIAGGVTSFILNASLGSSSGSSKGSASLFSSSSDSSSGMGGHKPH